MHYNKYILKLENLIASLIYFITNKLLIFLQFLLSSFRGPDNIKTILLFRTGNLGDIVCSIPAFKAVRKKFPSSRIILLTHIEQIFDNTQTLTSLIGDNIFNEIIYYKREDLKNLGKLGLLVNRIKRYRVDVMIYLSQYDVTFFKLLRDMLFFYFSGCKKLYGFKLNKHRIFRIAQRYYRKFDCENERLLKVLLPLGMYQENADVTLLVNKEDKQFIDNLWSNSQKLNSRPRVAINPGAKFPVRRWPKEFFLELAKVLVDRHRAFIILIGGRDAADICEFIENNLGYDCLNLCGRTNFMQTAEAISRCDLLVSCDSGPLHLAVAVRKPVVGVYSARDYPNCWYPIGDNHIIIRHDLPCQICLKTKCMTAECIKTIEMEEVLAACQQILFQKRVPEVLNYTDYEI